jgi:hypothetical protein
VLVNVFEKGDYFMLNLQSIHQAVTELQNEFRQNPALFFTEHDLASRCYSLIQSALQYPTVTGKDGSLFYLVHLEYPTPFRCDMSNENCDYKSDDDPTPQGNKYQRGHYDLVVFSPAFLKECTYELVNGQNYEQVKRELPAILYLTQEPAILLGLEFSFNSATLLSQKQAENWRDSVLRDYKKLQNSESWEYMPFMKEYQMLAFDGARENEYSELLKEAFKEDERLEYISIVPAKK